MIKFSLFIIFSLLLSCGKALDEKSRPELQKEEILDGIYSAVLLPVNPRLNSDVHGDVKISKYSDYLEVVLNVKSAPHTRIKQALHTGEVCPSSDDDINRDGYIYAYEAYPITGFIVLPLDNDLSSQESGENLSLTGSYRYKKSTSYYLMLSDLHLPDEVINDSMVKLNSQDLIFSRKVVTLYSETINGEIPIACGILNKISNAPAPDDNWSEGPFSGPVARPRARPRPDPRPTPEVEPEPETEPRADSWWDRLRQRWRRWRDRMPVGGDLELQKTVT